MCSLFFVPSTNINNSNNNSILSNMDQSFQGDLTDILRGSTNSANNNSGYGDQLGLPNISSTDWHFSSDHQHDHHHNNSTIGNISTNNFSSLLEDDHQVAILSLPDIDHHHMPFGDPFSNMRDPLLHDNAGPAAAFFGASSDAASPGFFGVPGPAPAHALLDHHHQNHQQEAKFRPSCNIFSRMLQINPSSSTASAASAAIGPSSAAAVANKHVSEAAVGPAQCDNSVAAAVASPRGSVIKAGEGIINVGSGSQAAAAAAVAENMAGGGGGMQISSPRNPGIKRRKSQAKKVVCIPAPAAANSRASGEVVPSDLWAWRKYGQKPIKGSPYPRGYYRCSSSKGCSARKQVERSRTDPNMLVITYTSEHNHPWPTQRNALAGSTRSQPSKTTNSASSKTSPLITSSHSHQLGQIKTTTTSSSTSPIEELIKMDNTNDSNNASVSTTSASVKEENVDHSDRLDDDTAFSTDDHHDQVGFGGYRPSLCSNDVVSGNDQDAFFAELGEIEADPLNLLFSQGFTNSSMDNHHHQQHKGLMVTANNNNNDNKGLDPFAIFDWSEGNDNNKNNNKQRE